MKKDICEFCNSNLEHSSHFTKCHSKTNFFTIISVCHHCINTESSVEDFFYYPTPYSSFIDKLKCSIDSNLISPDFIITCDHRERIESRFAIDMEKQKRVLVKFLKEEKHLINDFLKRIALNLKDYKFSLKEDPYEHFNEEYKIFEFVFEGFFEFIEGKRQAVN